MANRKINNPKRDGIWDVGNAQMHVAHGALAVVSIGEAASTGLIDDETTVIKFGHNPNISTSAREEINEFGNLTRLTAASTYTVVSDASADDDTTGTGAWKVVLVYLDANYAEQSETITLDGLTPVVSTGSGLRLIRAYCTECGSGGENAGNIAITATTGGTTQGYIQATDGQTHQVAYTVPAGYTGYILGAQVSLNETAGGALKEATAFVEGWVRLYDENSTNNYQTWRSLYQVNINNHGVGVANLSQPTLAPIPEKSDIKMDAVVGVNDTELTARLFILLREN